MAWYKNWKEKLSVERGEAVGRAYETWINMKRRTRHASPERKEQCYAGISVCDRWKDFENFLADVGAPPAGMSIDLIDPRGNYEPHNCRWADSKTQSRNRTYVRFTEKDIADIRAAYRPRVVSQQVLADKYKVSQRTISKIVRGETWAA